MVPCMRLLPTVISPVHGRRRNVLPYYTPGRGPPQGRNCPERTGENDTVPYHFWVTTAPPGVKDLATRQVLSGGRQMIANAPKMFNFDLGETADAIRETVHDFSSNEIAPRAAEID